ncbi:MAG: hypothetical protein Q8R82_15580 [Hyphomonadaceae bacterium]|nr:hypothetical protein [Hyphomonadaceae bacterium]
MRVLGPAVLAMLVALQAGCDRSAEPAKPVASPTVVAPVTAARPTPTLAAPRGKFDAISTTAMGVTGDLSATEAGFAFSQGQTYGLEGVGTASGADPYAVTKASFSSLINVPDAAVLDVFRVTKEDHAQARNGGFCGAAPTTFIATHEGVDSSGAPALFLVAFSGASPPSGNSPENELCGTFMYAPSAGPPATK